jgi:1,4-dihydroxy-2-naphthoate octaprenyltransferase
VQFAASLGVALAMPLVLLGRGYSWGVLLPVLVAPLAWRHARILRESRSAGELIALLGATGKLLALYALLLAVGLAWR